MRNHAAFVKGGKEASLVAVSIATLVMTASLSAEAFAREEKTVEALADTAAHASSKDVQRQIQMNAVEQCYLRDGIHLDKVRCK